MPKTNRGKHSMQDVYFRNGTEPTTFFVALFSNAVPPTVDINTKSELTEVANGLGYVTGGISVARNSTDFDVHTEDDTNDRDLIQIKDLVWTCTGAPGIGPARWAALTDDNATQGSRLILDYWDLVSDRTISDTQTLTLQDLELRLNEV